jgi:hypothetical protein
MKMKSAMGFMTLVITLSCLNMAQGAENKGGKSMQKDSAHNPAAAQTSGSATGILTFNPEATFAQGVDEVQTVKLSYARVQATKDPFDKKKSEIRIVLSDLPVSDATMKEANGVALLVQTGKLQAIEFFLTADGKPSWGTLLYKMLSLSLNEQSFKFERKAFDGKTVGGKISMDVRNIVSGKAKYSCTATFSAPVMH